MDNTLIEIPELDTIPIIKWYKPCVYTLLQLKEIDNLFKHEIWITKERIQIKVKDMSTSHILNCIKCWNGKGFSVIPENYLGGKQKWLEIFNKELNSRKLNNKHTQN